MNNYLTKSQHEFLAITLMSIHVSYRADNVDEYTAKVDILKYYLISEFDLQLYPVRLVILMEETNTICDETIDELLSYCTCIIRRNA